MQLKAQASVPLQVAGDEYPPIKRKAFECGVFLPRSFSCLYYTQWVSWPLILHPDSLRRRQHRSGAGVALSACWQRHRRSSARDRHPQNHAQLCRRGQVHGLHPARLPRQEYWRALPFPPPGDLPHLGTEPASPASLALPGRFSGLSHTSVLGTRGKIVS